MNNTALNHVALLKDIYIYICISRSNYLNKIKNTALKLSLAQWMRKGRDKQGSGSDRENETRRILCNA